METAQTVEITPVFVDGYMPDYDTFEERKVYISRQYNTAIHRCLCGCGGKTVMPIGDENNTEKTECTMQENEDKVSFSPSVGNWNFPCRSHYVITNNIANFIYDNH